MDNIREEFEVWALAQHLSIRPEGRGDDYYWDVTRLAWSAWKASRAALCVELPEVDCGGLIRVGYENAVAEITARLDQAGVSHK